MAVFFLVFLKVGMILQSEIILVVFCYAQKQKKAVWNLKEEGF